MSGAAVILGAWERELLAERSMAPILVIGPTGSGKTTTVVHPTLLTGWGESVVVWDFKGTLAGDTGAARERLGDVVVLDLARPGGPRYNPLMAVRPEPHLVPDCQHAARIITEAEREGHWRNAAFAYLSGVFVWLLTSGADADKCLAGARRHLLDGDKGLRRMLTRGSHPTAKRAAQELWEQSEAKAAQDQPDLFTAKSAGTPVDKSLHYRKSVYVTASVLLAEFEDPVLDAQTATSDFSIADLVAGDRPVTLYILARPLDARRLRRVFKLILTQMVDFLTVDRGTAEDGRTRRWRVLFVLDEFLQFQMGEAAEWARYVREYGIRLLLLAQSLADVEAQYGEGLVANCRLLAFRPNSAGEAERLSAMVGDAITEVPTRTTSKGLLDLFPTISRGTRIDRRPVLPMHEALSMAEEELILFGYGKPIRGRRLHPWADPRWQGLYGPPVRPFQPRPNAARWLRPRSSDPSAAAPAGPVPAGVSAGPERPAEPERPAPRRIVT
ncbi:MAG: hypothetical protein RLY86_4375 [Pseudomonadota bacterium]|jgi:type IV secretion system protein VirD4